jgi:ABC-type dipeptide/oligopeptide/nickel transport system ATPase subunit
MGVSLALERLNVYLRKKTAKEVFACGDDRKRKIKKQTTKHMLRDIDGVIHPGQLLAIMGGSGTAQHQGAFHITQSAQGPFVQEAERRHC